MLADLAIINATVRTMNPNQPTAQAVAITKNKIAKVGSNQEISKLIGKDTRVISVNGKTVLPGLIDTHVHVADFGRCIQWLDLTSVHSIEELQDLLKERIRQVSAKKWILGRGWNQNRFKDKRLPSSSDLNLVSPDNPVVLYHESAMLCVANSKAIEIAEISKQPVPSGGMIDKDHETGELTGILRDAATNLIWQVVPEPTGNELSESTVLACKKIAEAGLTSVHWLVLSEKELPIIQNLSAEGRLPIRINVIIPQTLIGKKTDFKTDDSSMLHLGGALIVADGYLASKTAALFEDYRDEPGKNGSLLCVTEDMKVSVSQIIKVGLQPIIHAMGDKAVDTALICIEHISKQTKGKTRFRIEQAAVLNENLIQRLKNAEVLVSVQPLVISSEFLLWKAEEHLGAERANWVFPLKTLLNKGVKLVGGSDCPMEPLNPLLGIQGVVTRDTFPEQRLNFEEALRMYTIDAAFSSGEESVKGSIEEGKLADLTILSCDPMVVEPLKIKDIDVDMVIINGGILKG